MRAIAAFAVAAPLLPALVGCAAEDDELFAYVLGPGSEHVFLSEIERGPHVSVFAMHGDTTTNSLGGAFAGVSCLADAAQRRGFSHFAILDSEITHKGTQDDPGNDGLMTVGFCHGETPEDLAPFEGLGPQGEGPGTVFRVDDVLGRYTLAPLSEFRVPPGDG